MANGKPKLRSSFLASITVVAGLVLAVGLTLGPRAGAPVATWQFGADRRPVEPFTKVPRFEPMRLSLTLPAAAFVYVASFDYEHGATAYFPSEYLGTDLKDGKTGRMHWLSAGTHELPGPWGDKTDQAWFVPGVRETLSLCVVVSREPVPELEAKLALCMQVGNTAFPDKSMGRYMPRAGKDKRIGLRGMPHPALQAAMHQPDSVTDGPMVPWREDADVFVKVLNILPDTQRPGVEPPGSPFHKQLREAVKDKVDVGPVAPK